MMRRAVLVFFIYMGLAGFAAADEPRVGAPAPALTVPQFDQQLFDLAGLKGKVVVINVWASWCEPCRAEMPMLDALYRRTQPQGLAMLALSADRPRQRQAAMDYMRAFAIPAGLAQDATANGFSTAELPTTFIIDRQGVVRAILTPESGPLAASMLAAAVEPLLAGR